MRRSGTTPIIFAFMLVAWSVAISGGTGATDAAAGCTPPEPTDLATLDLSVTHRVRGVYFTPRDRPFSDCLAERLDTWMRMAQDFFREEMAAEGYLTSSGRGKSFVYETDAAGRWDVVFMVGEHDAGHYQDPSAYPGGVAFQEMLARLPSAFHNNNVTVYFYDLAVVEGDHLLYTGQGGSGAPWEGDEAGYVLQGAHFLGVGFDTLALCIRDQGVRFEQTASSGLRDVDGDGQTHVLTQGQYASTDIGASIHELGHALYMEHDFTDYDGDGIETNLMGQGFRRFSGRYTPRGYVPATGLGPRQAAQLDGRLMFNPSCSDTDGDLVCDEDDLCPGSDDRTDGDCDATPDACDGCTDSDLDGFGDPGYSTNLCAVDNCPMAYNPIQEDADSDGIGDACDICRGQIGMTKARLRYRSLGRPSVERLEAAGTLAWPGMLPRPPLEVDSSGMRIQVAELEAGGGVIMDHRVPGGLVGAGAHCGPNDGWKTNVARTNQRYTNRTNQILPPLCAPGSALGIFKARAQDKTATRKGAKFDVAGKLWTYSPVTGPFRLTIVLGGDAESLAGQCGEHTFAAGECRRTGATLRCVHP